MNILSSFRKEEYLDVGVWTERLSERSYWRFVDATAKESLRNLGKKERLEQERLLRK